MNENHDAMQNRELEDSLSLVDLIVVLLKWRRFILITIVTSLVLAAIAYFVYPSMKMASSKQERVTETSMNLMIGIGIRTVMSEADATSFLLQRFNQPALVLAALRQSSFQSLEGIDIASVSDEAATLNFIRRRVIENKDMNGRAMPENARILAIRNEKGVFFITLRNSDPKKAESFLFALADLVDRGLLDLTSPLMEKYVSAFDAVLKAPFPNGTIPSQIVQGVKEYALMKDLIDGTSKALIILSPPSTYVSVISPSAEVYKRDILKKGVLFVIAMAFLSVLLAFMLNYVDVIKRDSQSMAKIRSAIGKS